MHNSREINVDVGLPLSIRLLDFRCSFSVVVTRNYFDAYVILTHMHHFVIVIWLLALVWYVSLPLPVFLNSFSVGNGNYFVWSFLKIVAAMLLPSFLSTINKSTEENQLSKKTLKFSFLAKFQVGVQHHNLQLLPNLYFYLYVGKSFTSNLIILRLQSF